MLAQPVRGTHDLYGEECQKHLKVIEEARRISGLYGYEEIITPIFEVSRVFERLGESSDVVSKETYKLVKRGKEDLTLRPEGTAGVVRAAISNGLTQQLPLKFFYAGPMFRYDRPQKGRFREFDQIGVELIGIREPQGDVEAIALGAHILEVLGLQDSVTLEINTLGDQESREAYRESLVGYFSQYSSSLSKDSLERLSKNPLRILDSKDPGDREIVKAAPLLSDFLSPTSQQHFEAVLHQLEILKIPYRLNPRLVRGLDYYCHTAFEFVSEDLGAQGTVMGGGRYDGLFKMMGGPDVPGVGWAAGVERLTTLWDPPEPPEPKKKIMVIPVGEEAQDRAIQISQELRKEGKEVELGFSGNLSKGLKRAHKIGASRAILLGEDELKNHQALVRDLESGTQTSISLEDLVSSFLKESLSR